MLREAPEEMRGRVDNALSTSDAFAAGDRTQRDREQRRDGWQWHHNAAAPIRHAPVTVRSRIDWETVTRSWDPGWGLSDSLCIGPWRPMGSRLLRLAPRRTSDAIGERWRGRPSEVCARRVHPLVAAAKSPAGSSVNSSRWGAYVAAELATEDQPDRTVSLGRVRVGGATSASDRSRVRSRHGRAVDDERIAVGVVAADRLTISEPAARGATPVVRRSRLLGRSPLARS